MNLGRENETLEFKKTISELKEGLISLSSMLNKNGEGILYFGVKNNGDVFGQKLENSTISNITNKIKNHIKPIVNPNITCETYDNLSVIKVEVSGADRPYSAYGRYYRRRDDQDLEMTHNELDYLFNIKDISSSWERELTSYGEDYVDEDLLIKFIDKANECYRLNYRYKSVEDAMTMLGLMENGKMNNAGYYLFSNNKPLTIKIADYADDERKICTNYRQFQGNIFECIDKAFYYIINSINKNAVIVGMKRVEMPEIPFDAIREIIINSFAHMRVIDGEFNEVSITPHYVRIYNPGTMPTNTEPKDFAKSLVGSKLRNPLIALTLYKDKTIEDFGSGFKHVFDLCRTNDVKYSYKNEETGFSFTFERNITPLLRKNLMMDNEVRQKTIEKLDDTAHKIYEYIVKNKIVKNSDKIAKALNKSPVTIRRGLERLVKTGLIERIGSNKTGYWTLT